MGNERYVQHISRKGRKWRLVYGYDHLDEWMVYQDGKSIRRYYLPKSEFILCDPPEEWEDVTARCRVDRYRGTNDSRLDGYYYIEDAATSQNALFAREYRLRKIDGMYNGPAFIVERKK